MANPALLMDPISFSRASAAIKEYGDCVKRAMSAPTKADQLEDRLQCLCGILQNRFGEALKFTKIDCKKSWRNQSLSAVILDADTAIEFLLNPKLQVDIATDVASCLAPSKTEVAIVIYADTHPKGESPNAPIAIYSHFVGAKRLKWLREAVGTHYNHEIGARVTLKSRKLGENQDSKFSAWDGWPKGIEFSLVRPREGFAEAIRDDLPVEGFAEKVNRLFTSEKDKFTFLGYTMSTSSLSALSEVVSGLILKLVPMSFMRNSHHLARRQQNCLSILCFVVFFLGAGLGIVREFLPLSQVLLANFAFAAMFLGCIFGILALSIRLPNSRA